MRVLSPSAAIVILALAAGAAQADGLLYQLPKDGAWARYEMEIAAKIEMEIEGKIDEQEMEASGSLRMASVGRTTEKGEPCRWIEVNLETKMKTGEGKERVDKRIAKVLIPEKYLKKGESPLDHVVRAWHRRENGGPGREPRQLEDPKDANQTPLPIVLAGPFKDVQQLEEVVVESKLGKLSCAGLTGHMEFKMRGDSTMQIKMENRLHPKAPFGVVSSRWIMQGTSDGGPAVEMTWNLKLSELGEDAKSELPDQQ
jgi:hypothetical protein